MKIIQLIQEHQTLYQTNKEHIDRKLEEIEKLRSQMYQYYHKEDNQQELIRISQELDKLLYEYIASTHKQKNYSN
ncbi:aspartyl-phosphate phosphatase Spo0E family protein [Paraliobacillus ryukyuensis]|uniref:aspartyl-phosphate phosphatase Spo0E family protein n=1 Tax=Paraliobacillus ryukyuensis TaxID=200904 RepID=UPI001FE3FCFF|nr:aspartyl-phosphate phosphatase Spo0E family protein [Paraliobacillus ryukyuensis]